MRLNIIPAKYQHVSIAAVNIAFSSKHSCAHYHRAQFRILPLQILNVLCVKIPRLSVLYEMLMMLILK